MANGWYRCSITALSNGTNAQLVFFTINADINQSFPTYAGGGGNLYLWGAQLETGSVPTDYIPTTTTAATSVDVLAGRGTAAWNATGALIARTTRTNLLIYSQDLNFWSTSATTATTNATTAPDATLTAEKITDTAGTSHHVLLPGQAGIVGLTGKTITYSVYAKADTLRWLQLVHNATPGVTANFDLVNGVLGATSGVSLLDAVVTPVGNGWYRCSITFALVAASPTLYFALKDADVVGLVAYTGTGTGSLYLWGAQLEEASSPTAYIPTASAAVTVSFGAALTGAGTVITPPAFGTGTLTTGVAALVSNGSVQSTGTADLVAANRTLAGAGITQVIATGALAPSIATLAGAGLSSSRSTSTALVPLPSGLSANGQTASSGTGTLTSVATLAGAGVAGLFGTAALVAGTATLAATGSAVWPPITGTGTLASSVVDLSAFGTSESLGTAGGGAVINTGAGPGNASYLGTPSGQKYSQNVYSLGTQIKSVQLWLSQLGTSVCGNVSVKLYTVDGAHLPATLLATSNTVLPSTSLPASATLCTFVFDPPLATTNGAELSVVLETEFIAPGNANCLFGYLRSTSVYPNAQWRFFDGAWRSDYTTYDIPLLVDQTFAGGLKAATTALTSTGTAGSAATGVLACSTATLAAAGVSESRSTSAALASQSNFLKLGDGLSASLGTGALTSFATLSAVGGVPGAEGAGTLVVISPASLVGAGLSRAQGTGTLTSAAASVVGAAVAGSVGTATLAAPARTLAGAGVSRAQGNGVLTPAPAVVNSVGNSAWVASGALVPYRADIVASGLARHVATGALPAGAAAVAGAGLNVSRETSAALQASVAYVSGFEGVTVISGTATLQAQSHTESGFGVSRSLGTGGLYQTRHPHWLALACRGRWASPHH